MANHHKVDAELSPEEIAELEALARKPGCTVNDCHQWLLERGFTISHGAVGNWVSKFRELLMKERFSRSSELAQAIRSAVEGGNFDDVATAANLQLLNVVFEQSARMQAEGEIDPEQIESHTRSLKNLVGTKAQHAKMLAEKFDAKAKDLVNAKRQITQEDVDEVRKAVFG
jgi:hypothetical protein